MTEPEDQNRAALLRMPKTDLHCHLDGSVRPATVLELARRLQVKLPADNTEDLKRYVSVAPTCGSLKEFLDIFDLIYPLLRSAAAVERIAYELIEDCARENIRHVEVRFAPALQETRGFSNDQVVSAALQGLKRGLADFGTSSSVIICLFRSSGTQESKRSFATLKRSFRRDATLGEPSVVGLDLAGDEASFPTLDFADYYREAAELGIATTCHAGETEGTKNIEAALELGVDRIGHGTHLLEDKNLLSEVIRRRIPLEIGITSNVLTRSVPELKKHPVLPFHKAGVPITLNTDDRALIGIDLTHEYEAALKLGFTMEELRKLSLASVDHIFLPEAQRDLLRRRFESELFAAPGAGSPGR